MTRATAIKTITGKFRANVLADNTIDVTSENPELEKLGIVKARLSEQYANVLAYEGQTPEVGDEVVVTHIRYGGGQPTEISAMEYKRKEISPERMRQIMEDAPLFNY